MMGFSWELLTILSVWLNLLRNYDGRDTYSKLAQTEDQPLNEMKAA